MERRSLIKAAAAVAVFAVTGATTDGAQAVPIGAGPLDQWLLTTANSPLK